MESFFSRYKNALVLIAILLAQVIGLGVQIRRPQAQGRGDSSEVRLMRYWIVSAVSPFERVFLFVGQGVRTGWSNYVNLRGVRQQNKDLQAEVNRLRLEQAGLAEDARQGQRLQALLAFKQQYVSKTLAAQIIGTSGTDQSHVLYIDKGSADGLRTDMPVITPDGIVGKIRDVFPHTAQVLEINDVTSGAGVIMETTRIRGILRGNAAGQPQIVDLLPDERIKPGEKVLTSGGDQIYPRGLPVGVITQIKPDPDHDPYVVAIVKPAADLARLEEVLVITDVSSQMSPSMKQDIGDSEAVEEAAHAADVMAERLPGLKDPNATNGQQDSTNPNAPPPLRPVPALHPDRFTPGATPPAEDLTPGKAPNISVDQNEINANTDQATQPEVVIDGAKAAKKATKQQ
ncbi:MAG: rod shape-determining protein MreC [Acidobacteriaceae bacterium]